MKKFLSLVVALSTLITAMAQTPEWKKQLEEVSKLGDQYYEQKSWKKLLECAVKERQNDVLVRTLRSDTLFLEAVKHFELGEYEIMFKNFIKADLENSVYPHTV